MPMREENEDAEGETYSSDAGSEGDSEADRKRRRPRRKRRPKPEAIAARLKTDADGSAEPAATARRAKRWQTERFSWLSHPERSEGAMPRGTAPSLRSGNVSIQAL